MSQEVLEGNSGIFWEGTLADMIDQDILDHGMGGANETDGFSLGKRGKSKFWMWDPTPNGYYKIYEQDESGFVVGVRYVDAMVTKVRVHRNNQTQKR